MSTTHPNLHGDAPTTSSIALILVDVINDFDFPEGGELLKAAMPAAERILLLKEEAAKNDVPIIYVNDNFGRWRSDFKAIVEHCCRREALGRPVAEMLRPGNSDYFVLKPKHSGFYCTALELLLKHLHAKRVVIAGFAGNICVLFTANDAYMRDFDVIVPSDCIASNSPDDNLAALAIMQQILKADIRPSSEINHFH